MQITTEKKDRISNLDDSKTELYIIEKRNEIIFSLASQGYTQAQIGRMFRLERATVGIILKRMPNGYVSPWKKIIAD